MDKPTFSEFMRRVIPVTTRSGQPAVDTSQDPDALTRMRNIIRDGGANPDGQVPKILGMFRAGDDLLQLNIKGETGELLPMFLIESRMMHHCRAIYRQAF